VLCRGGIEIKSLNWDKHRIRATLVSTRKQELILRAPADVESAVVTKGRARIRMGRIVKAGSCYYRWVK